MSVRTGVVLAMGSSLQVLPEEIGGYLDRIASAGCGLSANPSPGFSPEFFPEDEWRRLMARAGDVRFPLVHFTLSERGDAVYLPGRAFASAPRVWEVPGHDTRFLVGNAEELFAEASHVAASRPGSLEPALRALMVRAGSVAENAEPLWVIHAASLLRPGISRLT